MSPPFIRQLKAQLKGIARRQRDLFFPDRATLEYRAWMARRMQQRAQQYRNALEPGLLSIITAVWDGSPLKYFRKLADSIASQVTDSEVQWFILSNGCTRPDLLEFFQQLRLRRFITVHHESKNTGIVKGLRLCLEGANGRYVLPVDADDKLYEDALRVVTAHIQGNSYPPLLYTDEDKISGSEVYQPYFKPDWDPVLLANSAYIAHLGVVDRELALRLDAYGDSQTEGSPDWDLFTRFANAGHCAVHIPEVVYSWRIHADSTADDAATKPYILSSQKAVLRRFLDAHSRGCNFDIASSSLFGPDAAHLRLTRSQLSPSPVIVPEGLIHLSGLLAPAEKMAGEKSFIGLIGEEVQPLNTDWIQEALGLFELFPDAMMVGGRFYNAEGVILDGPNCLGFNGSCSCPDNGRKVSDPGYFGQMFKQRSVSAVSSKLALIRASDLLKVIHAVPQEATLLNLGCWIGAEALRQNRRIIYSPFLDARIDSLAVSRMAAEEERVFLDRYRDLMPDRRYYPEPFSLERGYELPDESITASVDKLRS